MSPSWISDNGVWKPAKERAYDGKKDEIYEGPDRAAKEILQEDNVPSLGMPVENDPQILELARQRGHTVKEYLEQNRPTEAEVQAQKEAQSKTVEHKDPPKKRGVKPRGGGVTISGGFGDMPS
jgi:hypothetical protein